eukprot:1428987-Amphidinium_carterae.1
MLPWGQNIHVMEVSAAGWVVWMTMWVLFWVMVVGDGVLEEVAVSVLKPALVSLLQVSYLSMNMLPGIFFTKPSADKPPQQLHHQQQPPMRHLQRTSSAEPPSSSTTTTITSQPKQHSYPQHQQQQ